MASDRTEHYGLNQWTGEDSFLRAEFNEDNAKVDAALAVKCEVVFGYYVGNSDTATGEQTIQLGYTPRALFVTNDDGNFTLNSYTAGGFVIGKGVVDAAGSGSEYLDIVDGGFKVKNGTFCYINRPGKHYYMAIR